MYIFSDEDIKKLRSSVSDLLLLQSQYIIEECLNGRYCSCFKDMREDFEYQEEKFYKYIHEHYFIEEDLPFPDVYNKNKSTEASNKCIQL